MYKLTKKDKLDIYNGGRSIFEKDKRVFNLSSKINDYGYDDDGTPDEDVIAARDVKKFIKLLKRKGSIKLKFLTLTDDEEDEIRKCLNERIDKLAGSDLK